MHVLCMSGHRNEQHSGARDRCFPEDSHVCPPFFKAAVTEKFVPFQNQRVRLIAENVNSSPKVKVDRLRFGPNVRPKDLGEWCACGWRRSGGSLKVYIHVPWSYEAPSGRPLFA